MIGEEFDYEADKKRKEDWKKPQWVKVFTPCIKFLMPDGEQPWLKTFTKDICPQLHPEFAWPQPSFDLEKIAPELPKPQPLYWPFSPGTTAVIYWFLLWFSHYYCKWYGYERHGKINPLPFGLILLSNAAPLPDIGPNDLEVNSIRSVREAGIPVPMVIGYAEHPDETGNCMASILMKRMPGETLHDAFPQLNSSQKETIFAELKMILDAMHSWKNPRGEAMCTIDGNPLRSRRIPLRSGKAPIFKSHKEFTDYILDLRPEIWLPDKDTYEKAVAVVQEASKRPYKTVFCHGDFTLLNVMVHDDHVSGLVNWDAAGWLPEYWDFQMTVAWIYYDDEEKKFVQRLRNGRYEDEIKLEDACADLQPH